MRSILALLFLLGVCWARQQTVGVRGQLMCGDEPLKDATVKLWDRNTFPIPDSMLAEATTDASGKYEVHGTANDLTTMKPTVKFYHRCNNKHMFNIPKLCKRKIAFDIPKKYINSGKDVGKWYEMGVTNMEAKQKKEDSECIGPMPLIHG